MRTKQRTLAATFMLIVPLLALAYGCAQSDNPTPTAAPAPPPPKASELELPKVKGKTFDPSTNDRYKKMQENMAKQYGGS